MPESWRGVLAAAMAGAIAAGLTGCTAPRSAVPTPPVTAGMLGTHGIVTFVSTRVGWVVAPHPRLHSTAVYRTIDGGLDWVQWGTLSGEAGPVALTESAVLLMKVAPNGRSSLLEFSSDGVHWESRQLPYEERVYNIQFLTDLQHGWLVHDQNPPPPADLFHTTDGGRTWNRLATQDLTYNESGGSSPFFWNATDGAMSLLRQKGFALLFSHDGGTSWQQSVLPVIDAARDLHSSAELSLSPGSPTMVDDLRGLLPIYVENPSDVAVDSPLRRIQYVTRTVDGGRHWSAAEMIRLPAAGLITLLDDKRWLLAGAQRVHFTSDSGVTWREAQGLDASLSRSSWPAIRALESDRNVAFLTFMANDIQWLDVTTDAGAHWQAVPLPDIREASWTGGRPPP